LLRGILVFCDLPTTQIFRYPWTITMTIAATRMYRGLDDFLSTETYENHVFLSSVRSLR
jgi:hypothetical protein